jgi:zeaxanthin glucosyltransferase
MAVQPGGPKNVGSVCRHDAPDDVVAPSDVELRMKIGFVSLPVYGHLNPIVALARKLQTRSHEISFIGVADAEATVKAAGLNFICYCESEYPLGSDLYAPTRKLHGLDVVKCACQVVLPPFVKAALDHLPEKLAGENFDLLVIDAVHFFIELVPMSMGIPYVHIWTGLDIDSSGMTPPSFFDWPLDTSTARERNIHSLQEVAGTIFPPLLAVAVPQAEKLGLKIDWHDRTATASKLAVIAQYPREFDFPDIPRPPHFHYCGPFQDENAREPVPFPWEKLTGKPLIYASMGTLMNGSSDVFDVILEAVAKLPEVQAVLSIGEDVGIDNLQPIPPNAIVVERAPQLELLKKAELCLTHAGLNTTLEALAQGVPMVAVPVGFDQPGVAARIAHHGVGEFVRMDEKLSVERLTGLIRKVMGDPMYRHRANDFKQVFSATDGLTLAADLIERAYKSAIAASGVRTAPTGAQ